MCIPIRKQIKLQVKSDPNRTVETDHTNFKCDRIVEQDVRHDGSKCRSPLGENVEQVNDECNVMSEQVEANKNSTPNTESNMESIEVRSPTLSLLRAQDLMFDPKYMYKEYNLRKTRKEMPAAGQVSPEKNQKVGRSIITNMSTERLSDKVKRGRSSLDIKESTSESPNPKKMKEDADDTADQKCTQIGNDANHAVPLDFSGSLCRSIVHQVTLTDLLAMPKNKEKGEHVPSSPDTLRESKIEIKEKIGESANKVHSQSCRIQSVGSRSRHITLCSLCKQKGSISSLGFLFGPYFYHLEASENSTRSEVWLHEDCSVWAPGVCIVGREIKGLREALFDANKMVRSHCIYDQCTYV